MNTPIKTSVLAAGLFVVVCAVSGAGAPAAAFDKNRAFRRSES
jgi:hypothetical protein